MNKSVDRSQSRLASDLGQNYVDLRRPKIDGIEKQIQDYFICVVGLIRIIICHGCGVSLVFRLLLIVDVIESHRPLYRSRNLSFSLF